MYTLNTSLMLSGESYFFGLRKNKRYPTICTPGNEAIGVIGRRIGWPDLAYVQFPYEEAAKEMVAMGISPDVSRLFVEMSRALNDGLFAVNRPRTAENTTPTAIEDFAGTFAAAFEAAELKKAA